MNAFRKQVCGEKEEAATTHADNGGVVLADSSENRRTSVADLLSEAFNEPELTELPEGAGRSPMWHLNDRG